MQLHVVTAVITAGCFVTGCGFIPKSPPTPSDAQRIPVNQAAPYIGPWPPPALAVAPSPAPSAPSTTENAAPEPLDQPATQSEPPGVAVATDAVSMAPKPIGWWPITVPFRGSDTLQGMDKSLPLHNVSFSWPKTVGHHEPKAPPGSTQPAAASTNSSVDVLAVTSTDVVAAKELPAIKPRPAAAPVRVGQATTTTRESAVNATAEPASESPSTQQPPDASKATSASDVSDAATVAAKQEPAPEPAPDPVRESKKPEPLRWAATRGITLSDLLREWGKQEQWTVYWESALDFRIEATFSLEASNFLDAVNKILRAYRDAGRTITAKAYTNQVLVVNVPSD